MKPTKSTLPVSGMNIKREWHLIDMANSILGRKVPEIVKFLQGKHKTDYSPNLDTGDYVIVINAAKVKMTGNKSQTKKYTNFSGYPGGLTTRSFNDLLLNNPSEIVRHAVSGMLPKNKLRDPRLSRLFIYKSSEHPYKNKIIKK